MKLIPIDLTIGERKNHPDFNEDDYFLVKYDGFLIVGKFRKVWFGWNFQWYCSITVGLQYDKPGTNFSSWEEVWRIDK